MTKSTEEVTYTELGRGGLYNGQASKDFHTGTSWSF